MSKIPRKEIKSAVDELTETPMINLKRERRGEIADLILDLEKRLDQALAEIKDNESDLARIRGERDALRDMQAMVLQIHRDVSTPDDHRVVCSSRMCVLCVTCRC